jgi:hypothetical protein
MIQKKFVKSHNRHQISFEIPKDELPEGMVVETIAVVGDFNSWDPHSHPLKATKKGDYKATIELDPAHHYQFRYLANGEYWFNAWNPDGFSPNGLGDENCVLLLEVEEPVFA